MNRKDAELVIGICARCSEWTSLAEPCCPNAPIWANGTTYHPDEVEQADDNGPEAA